MYVQIVFRASPLVDGEPVTCPEARFRGPGGVLTLTGTTAGVVGSCGREHYSHGLADSSSAAECMFTVGQLDTSDLEILLAQGRTGRVRGSLPSGRRLDAQIISLGGPAAGATAPAPATGAGAGGRTPRGRGAAAAAFGAASRSKGTR
ncbi:hypothetical protein SAMN04490357_7675 [Streptomyces misionensis]|uniref:Uncharacterized protein n=1 Tax=Streptomyces misionensis TaxID=67331 RepID=A0A1H5K2F4_9ACTN|nr:hypothetical protein [Streptomyces misionensis]SEE58992.1 hypothetical protein SAMN04490357_7675 [Streptomyces misionensis]